MEPQEQNDPPTTPSVIKQFKYVAEEDQRPAFTQSENEEVNQVSSDVYRLYQERIINGRKSVDDALKEFKRRTNNPEDAPLTACLEAWKKMAFTDDRDEQKAWNVEFNESQQIKRMQVNLHRDYLSHEALNVDNSMNSLLDNCHTLFNNHNFTKDQMEMEKAQMCEKITVRTRKIEAVFSEMEAMNTAMDKIVDEVDGLLENIKIAVAKHMVVKNIESATGLKLLIR